MDTRYDILPLDKSETIETIRIVYKRSDITKLYETARILLTFLSNGLLWWTEKPAGRKQRQHFQYLLENRYKIQPFRPSRVDWERVERRLSRAPQRESANIDGRVCYLFGTNSFLVNALFTFGQRTVPEGTVHVIQTTHAPVLFYGLKTASSVRNSTFVAKDQFLYDLFVLQPHTVYRVDPGTVYVVVTVQKTFFAMDAVSIELADREHRHLDMKDPMGSRTLLHDPYKQREVRPISRGSNAKRVTLSDDDEVPVVKYVRTAAPQQTLLSQPSAPSTSAQQTAADYVSTFPLSESHFETDENTPNQFLGNT